MTRPTPSWRACGRPGELPTAAEARRRRTSATVGEAAGDVASPGRPEQRGGVTPGQPDVLLDSEPLLGRERQRTDDCTVYIYIYIYI